MAKGDKVVARVEALSRAVSECDGRSDPQAVARAARVVERIGQRTALSGDYTVVALAGSTGSGKSSLFNALTGTELAQAAARRPTTSKAMAVGWGSELPNELLDWLDVGKRHLIVSHDQRLKPLVLLDLPDHDSTEDSHRATVDRLVETVDALIWVVDPQKYADASLHDGYLKPLADHSDVMMVVLNQVDRLPADQVTACLEDLRSLLDREGLHSSPVMAVSATRGDGVYELRDSLMATVGRKKAMMRRLDLDVRKAAKGLAEDLGPKVPAKMNNSLRDFVTEGLAEAAGVPVVVEGVREAWLRRGAMATGWPLVSWISRLRPDPLRGLQLGEDAAQNNPDAVNADALPQASAVQAARVNQGLRKLVSQASQGMPPGWVRAINQAAHRNDQLLAEDLDKAIAVTDLKVNKGAWWWLLMTVLQWMMIAAVVGGLVWWLAGPALAGSGVAGAVASWLGVPAGAWIAVGGLLVGLLLSVLGRVFVRAGAESRADRAEKELLAAVDAVAAERVFDPVQSELDRYHRARDAIRAAQQR